MAEGDDTGSNEQKAVAKGAGSLAINAAKYASVTVYQYVTYSGDKVTLRETDDPFRCPYPGLETFRTSEAVFFAGREDDVAELEAKLRDHDICGVIAASGTGKSSLVHAGLFPDLATREAEAWDVFAFKPGQEPIYGLARALSGLLAKAKSLNGQLDEIDETVAALRKSPGRLRRYIEEIISRRADAADGKRHHVLIFVDQWEELYTRENDEDRDILVQELMDVAERGLAKVLLTMRIDFMDDLVSKSTDLYDVLEPALRILRPLSEAGRRAAIEKPAEVAGLGVPPELTSRLVADLGKDEGTLPYLQFVLRQLWEKRDKESNSLTTATYDSMDGLKGAIGAHADDVFRKLQKKEPELASLAQRVLPRLANVSETGAITSRRLPFADFDEPARKLLRKFAEPDSRLIVLSSATEEVAEAEIVAEVAHEALLDDWKTLSGWIADRKDFFRLRNDLEAHAKKWIENNQKHDFLIPAGKPLLDAAELQNDALEGDISEELNGYLNISFWKDRSRQWTRNGFFVALLVLAIGIATYFANLNRDLQASNTLAKREAAISQLSIAESEISDGRNTEAIVRLLAADDVLGFLNTNEYEASANARNLVSLALDRQRETLRIYGNFTSAALSPDGTIFLGDRNGKITQYEVSTGEKLQTVELGADSITTIEVSSSNDLLAATDKNGTVYLRSLVGNTELDNAWRSEHLNPSGLSLSEDGNELLVNYTRVQGLTPVLGFWKKGNESITTLKSQCGGGARIGNDGGEFAALEASRSAVIYSLPDEKVLQETFLGASIADVGSIFSCEANANYNCLWFSEDLNSIVTWSGPATISKIDLNDDHKQPDLADIFASLMNDPDSNDDEDYFDCRVAVSPSGAFFASNFDESAWRIFDLSNRSVQVKNQEPVLEFRGVGSEIVWGHNGTDSSSPVNDVSLLDDGRALLFYDGYVSLIEIRRERSRFKLHDVELTTISPSFSGGYLVAGSHDGFVTLINMETGKQVFQGFPLGEREVDMDIGFITSLSVSNDGRYLLIGTVGGSIQLIRLVAAEGGQSEVMKVEASHKLPTNLPFAIVGFLGASNVFAVTSGELDEVQVIDPSVGFEPIHRIPLPELWSVGSYQWASFTPIYSEFFGYEPETKTLTIFTYSDLKNEEITGSGPVEKIVISRERSNLHAELFDGKFSIHTGPTVLPGVSFNGELLVNRTGLKSPGEGTHGFGLRDFRPNGLEPAGAMTLSSDDQMVWMATFDGELVAYSLEFLTDELQELLCGTLPALPGSQLPELTDRLGVKWHCQKKLP